MSVVINSAGFGAAQLADLNADTISMCNSWKYWAVPPCWELSPDAWKAAAGLPALPASLIAAPGAPSNLTTIPDTTGQTAQDLSNAAQLQTQANVQEFVNEIPDNPLGVQPCEWGGIACWAWAAIGAVGVLLLVRR